MDPSLERTFKGHKNYVTSVAFSPSIKQIASGAGDNTIMLWNFKAQMRAFRFIGHKVSYVFLKCLLVACMKMHLTTKPTFPTLLNSNHLMTVLCRVW